MSYYPPSPVPVAPSGPITQDAPCRKCGYNLRGLAMEGRCPECGTAIGYSLQGDLLRFMRPEWVDTLRVGVSLIIWGVAVIFFGIIGTIFLAFATRSEQTVFLGVGTTILGWVLMLVGWILLTKPDPSGLGEDQYGTARKLIRIALAVGVVQQFVGLAEALLPLDPAMEMMLGVFTLAAGVMAVVGIVAQLQYLEKITQRIPDRALSDRARFLKGALGICYGITIFLGAVVNLGFGGKAALRAQGAAGSFQTLGCVLSIVGLTMLVFLIMYLLMLEKIGRRFKEQAQMARATWAAHSFTPTAAQ